MKQIAIIGGGASGVLTAIHILRSSQSPVSVVIYESAPEIAAGLAYGTNRLEHILNVPADRMSYDERKPHDFVDWLKAHKPAVFADVHYPFVSRMFFKEYLQDRLKESLSQSSLEILRQRVNSAEWLSQGQWRIVSGAQEKKFDECVVATGYSSKTFTPRGLMGQDVTVIDTPYSTDFKKIGTGDVAIVGMGLTAIDIWRSLRYSGFQGIVHFFSRRMLFPEPFTITKDIAVLPEVVVPASPLFLLEWVRAVIHFEKCDATAVANQLRAHVPEIWKTWSPFHKKQFLNHLRPYWDSIRHRLPDSVHRELMEELRSGKSVAHRAKGLRVARSGGNMRLNTQSESVLVGNIFIATGARLEDKPIEMDSSLYKKCGLGLGFESRHERLHFVGPITRTSLWEISAVPEIRIQAQSTAEKIVAID